MKTNLLVGGMVIGLIVLVAFLGFLFAYPTMWLVNYLFNPMFLANIFTTGHFTVWHAWALNILAGGGFLFKSRSTNSK